jgi:hypothetical protein
MAMGERIIFRGGGPLPEDDPLPLREAAGAAMDALRLAWEADRNGLLKLVALQTAATAAEVAQLFVSRGAVDEVVDGHWSSAGLGWSASPARAGGAGGVDR